MYLLTSHRGNKKKNDKQQQQSNKKKNIRRKVKNKNGKNLTIKFFL